MKGRKRGEENKGRKDKRPGKKTFHRPEIVEERDFAGVVAVTGIQTISNILPKTFSL